MTSPSWENYCQVMHWKVLDHLIAWAWSQGLLPSFAQIYWWTQRSDCYPKRPQDAQVTLVANFLVHAADLPLMGLRRLGAKHLALCLGNVNSGRSLQRSLQKCKNFRIRDTSLAQSWCNHFWGVSWSQSSDLSYYGPLAGWNLNKAQNIDHNNKCAGE